MVKEKIKYDDEKARYYFVVLKLIEIGCGLIFTFGIYILGLLQQLIVRKDIWFLNLIDVGDGALELTSVLGVWVLGWLFILNLCALALAIFIIVGLSYLIIRKFIELNWEWAKGLAEDPKEKEKRIAKKLAQERKDYGFVKGDEVKVKKTLVPDRKYDGLKFSRGMRKFRGRNAVIVRRDQEGYFRLDIDENRDWWWSKDMLDKKK
jgi:hypothetical protein